MTEKFWDLLIRGARVFDGSGELPRNEDIAVRDGRIAARGVGLPEAGAAQVIDATGKWLMPGLLDIHTHFDLEVEIAPGLPEAVRHGTTTVVVANCSLGLAFGNQRRDGTDPVVDCFARVENVPKHVLSKVADRADWEDSGAYLDHLDSLPLGANIVTLIPHSMLRIEVMGLQDSISREPTEAELDRMASLLDRGMRQGYAGLSTDALPFHYLANDPHRDRKIPTQYGSYGELKRLTDVVRRHGRVWQATPPKDSIAQTLRNLLLTSGRLHGRPLKTTVVAALDVATNRGIAKLGILLARLLNSRAVDGRFALQALAGRFKIWSEGPINPIFEEIPVLRRLNMT
ncbi:MAG: amidohydrolase family protein, partial [Gammaproteobacteria bacterium]